MAHMVCSGHHDPDLQHGSLRVGLEYGVHAVGVSVSVRALGSRLGVGSKQKASEKLGSLNVRSARPKCNQNICFLDPRKKLNSSVFFTAPQ